MKFVSENPNQLSGDKEGEIFDMGCEFFEAALKSRIVMFGDGGMSDVCIERLIAAKFYAEYQVLLLKNGRKLLKIINKEINKRIIEKYEK